MSYLTLTPDDLEGIGHRWNAAISHAGINGRVIMFKAYKSAKKSYALAVEVDSQYPDMMQRDGLRQAAADNMPAPMQAYYILKALDDQAASRAKSLEQQEHHRQRIREAA